MRLAVIAGRFPEVSETFVSRQVLELMRLGHEVEIYANRRGSLVPGAGDPLELPTLRLRVRPKRDLKGLLRLGPLLARPGLVLRLLNARRFGADALSLRLVFSAAAYARSPRYDAMIAHFGPNASVVSKLLSAGMDLGPLVAIFHGSDVRSARPGDFDMLFAAGRRFITVSRDLESCLLALGAPPERLCVIPNGVDLGRFKAPEFRGESGDELRLISVARLVPVKGLEHAIDAVSRLPERLRRRVRYEIVGEGPMRDELQSRIEGAGLGQNIRLLGAMPHERVAEMLGRADIFLMPSLNEGLPVAAIEASACGVPIVGSNAGGIPEVVADEVTGLLVPPGDAGALASAIERLEDPEARRKMGLAARERAVELFDARSQFERLAGLLESVSREGS